MLGRQLEADERKTIAQARLHAKVERAKRKAAGPRSDWERKQQSRGAARDCAYGAPANYSRRCELEADTPAWLKHYLPEAFPQPFAKIHLDYIADLDYIVAHGGWKAEALPRGSGKTTIALGFALKCVLTGRSEYTVILSATATLAKDNIAAIKTWLQTSERLIADYPEVCAPIEHARGIPQAMAAMTANGQPVTMRWTASQIVLPDCPRIDADGLLVPAVSANAILECGGITGALKGKKFARADGRMVRPDLAIPDDIQTPESARSPEQCRRRLAILKNDVACLGGPGRDVRIIAPCTIIEPGDVADEITDPNRTPDFLGVRLPFFLSMPTNMTAWDDYNLIRVKGLAARDKGRAAKAYYRKHAKRLQKGARVTWPARCGDNAIDGIQWGMDMYFRLGPAAFATEMQNAPIPPETLISLTKAQVLECAAEFPRWELQADYSGVLGFIDCNPRTPAGLSWAVVGFGELLSGRVLAYGRYPGRGLLVPAGASEAQEAVLLFEGLRKLVTELTAAPIITATRETAKIDLVMIDGGYAFNSVCKFVKACRFSVQVAVSRGRSASHYLDIGRDVVKAQTHVHLRKNQKGERYLSHNVDALRETAHRAFMAGPDAPGGISIHAGPPAHDEFAEAITSMRLTDKAEGTRGTLYRWSGVPGGHDHWLDCIVGCYAGAHWLGIENSGTRAARGQKKRPIKIRQRRI